MADKLILNADLNYKTAEFIPEKCVVEKVIEVSESEFKKFYEKPMQGYDCYLYCYNKQELQFAQSQLQDQEQEQDETQSPVMSL